MMRASTRKRRAEDELRKSSAYFRSQSFQHEKRYPRTAARHAGIADGITLTLDILRKCGYKNIPEITEKAEVSE